MLGQLLSGTPIGGGGSSSSGGGGGGLAAGTYVSDLQQATLPLPSDPSWVLTTKLNDVGVNDHTTSEGKTGAAIVYKHAMVVLAAASTLQSYTAAIESAGPAGSKVYHAPADGLAWTEWDDPFNPPPAGGTLTWYDKTQNPADAASKLYIGLHARDGTGAEGTFTVNIGDFRVTSA